MNIATADRLIALRKKNGYSQEALAEKLGVSRQAVSKWERAEASPDTNNLIALADIYSMTLDQLLDLNYDPNAQKKEETPAEPAQEKPVEEKPTPKKRILPNSRFKRVSMYPIAAKKLFRFPFPLFVIIAYILICYFLKNHDSYIWAKMCLIFILIPSYYMVAAACNTASKKAFCFALPVPLLVIGLYILIGITANIWIPSLMLFLILPLYYWMVAVYVKGRKKK